MVAGLPAAISEARRLPLLSSPAIAAYFHELEKRLSPSSANLHLSGIRQWLEWLTRSGVLPFNPAAAVRGVRLSREEGKTPVLQRADARLFASLEDSDDAKPKNPMYSLELVTSMHHVARETELQSEYACQHPP